VATIIALVSLSLDPASIDTDFIRVKYHKDQANHKDYSNEGLGGTFKKWQADNIVKYVMSNDPGVKAFEGDKDVEKAEKKSYMTARRKGMRLSRICDSLNPDRGRKDSLLTPCIL